MDRELEDMQFMGFFRIYKESFKIIGSWKKLLTGISTAFILPFSFIFLAHSWVSQDLYFRILTESFDRADTPKGSEEYARLSRSITSNYLSLVLAKAAYFTFVLVFSLLSTSAVVYSIACIYAGKEVTFRKVLLVVPRVWKRLVVTFSWSLAVGFGYNLVFGGLLLLYILYSPGLTTYWIAAGVGLIVLYIIGFVYIAMIWQLASVVCVLEDIYGWKAMVKSKALMKGKMRISIGCFVGIVLLFMLIQLAFELLVVIKGRVTGLTNRVLFGVACGFLLLAVTLVELVMQTVLYFVCKSFHHENIDKLSLANHLEVYRGDYVPLRSQSIQLEQIHV